MLHKLSLLNASPYSSGTFVCNICRESGCGPVYHCADCDFDVHVMCAATAKQQTHLTHPHHLLHLVQCTTLSHTCDSCATTIHTLSFRCDMCDFDIHPTCVRAPRFIQHPTHQHPLALSTSSAASLDSIQCDGCRRPVNRIFYKCDRGGLGCCNYALHQGCASLPTKMKHPKHPQHMLTLLDKPPWQEEVFSCGGCGARSRGWRFNCASCDFNLHPGCASSVHEFIQPVQDAQVITQQRSEASSSTTASVVCKVSHASAMQALSQAPIPSDKEWDAFEKVVQFARELATGHSSIGASSDSAQSGMNEEEDICPTCLEGYDGCNPKKLTSCGHHFHLACILNWMEMSPFCPICRSKGVSIRM